MRRRPRRGSALLDVVIALVVLALSGVAMLNVVGQTSHSMRSVRNTEQEIRAAGVELDRFVQYDRARLVALTGTSARGQWTITVTRRGQDLFDVSVADSTRAPLLHTTFYRPDTANAAP